MMMIRSLSNPITALNTNLNLNRLSTTLSRNYSVAIVGSGPSGLYCAKYLLSSPSLPAHLKVDVIDQLPTPFGLVRSGVAPDHHEVKNVQNDFTALFDAHKGDNGRLRFFGNVTVGLPSTSSSPSPSLDLAYLKSKYDAVVLSYGCTTDNILPIMSTPLKGVFSARSFVNYYNGHPSQYTDPEIAQEYLTLLSAPAPKEKKPKVIIIGQGNVALDCARVLSRSTISSPPSSPHAPHSPTFSTDVTRSALLSLEEATLQRGTSCRIFGRRSHVQASFTIKELRELTKLSDGAGRNENVDFYLDSAELNLAGDESLKELEGNRAKSRIDKLLRDTASASTTGILSDDEIDSKHDNRSSISLHFLSNPHSIQPSLADPTRVGSITFERMQLTGESGKQSAVGTGVYQTYDADMILFSVGYKGEALSGLSDGSGSGSSSSGDDDSASFDAKAGKLKHVKGKVEGAESLFCTGWIKRGADGIIASNIADARETVGSITSSFEGKEEKVGGSDISEVLKEKGIQFVDWEGWEKINGMETGEMKRCEEQPREKITSVERMLEIAS